MPGVFRELGHPYDSVSAVIGEIPLFATYSKDFKPFLETSRAILSAAALASKDSQFTLAANCMKRDYLEL
jgi:hypothetical protein